jgi:hypothetical protein
MNVTKVSVKTDAVIPLIAALPYGVVLDAPDTERVQYDPIVQLTRYAGRDFSTSRYDESVGGLFSSKSDTKKDD